MNKTFETVASAARFIGPEEPYSHQAFLKLQMEVEDLRETVREQQRLLDALIKTIEATGALVDILIERNAA
jgi:hypothetical protein